MAKKVKSRSKGFRGKRKKGGGMSLLSRYEAAVELQQQQQAQQKQLKKERKKQEKEQQKLERKRLKRQLKDLELQQELLRRQQKKQQREVIALTKQQPQARLQRLLQVMSAAPSGGGSAAAFAAAAKAAAAGICASEFTAPREELLSDASEYETRQSLASEEQEEEQEEPDGEDEEDASDADASRSEGGRRTMAAGEEAPACVYVDPPQEEEPAGGCDTFSDVSAEDLGAKEDDAAAAAEQAPRRRKTQSWFDMESFGLAVAATRLAATTGAAAAAASAAAASLLPPFDFACTFDEAVDDEVATAARRLFIQQKRSAAARNKGKGSAPSDGNSSSLKDSTNGAGLSHLDACIESLAGTAFCPVSLRQQQQQNQVQQQLEEVTLQPPGCASYFVRLSRITPRPALAMPAASAASAASAGSAAAIPGARSTNSSTNSSTTNSSTTNSSSNSSNHTASGSKTFLEGVLERQFPTDPLAVYGHLGSFPVDAYGAPACVARGLRRCLEAVRSPLSEADFPSLRMECADGRWSLPQSLASLYHLLHSYADVCFPHENCFATPQVRCLLAAHAMQHLLKARGRAAAAARLAAVLGALPDASSRQASLTRAACKASFDDLLLQHDKQQLQQQLQTRESPVLAEGATADAADTSEGDSSAATTEAAAAAGEEQQQPLSEAVCEQWLAEIQQDSGYTRPRVLLLAPFRSAAKQVVDALLQMLPENFQVLNRKRYTDEFGAAAGETIQQQQHTFAKARRPRDFIETFKGDSSDSFRLGLRLSNKALALYSPLIESDLIVASPLGLRTLTGAKGESNRNFDFLSSLEVVMIDRADIIALQNWQLLKELLEVANLPPQDYTSFDIRRLRPSMAAALGCTDRQLVICSSGRSPRLGALLHAFSSNRRGRIELFDPRLAAACMPLDIPSADCVAAAAAAAAAAQEGKQGAAWKAAVAALDAAAAAALEVAKAEAAKGKPRGLVPATLRCSRAGVQQLFCRVACREFKHVQRALIEYFSTQVLPALGGASRLLIVVPTFLELCRLRVALKEQRVSYSVCHEYTANAKLSRARQQFLKGDVPLLLTTSRFCFYRRYRLSGCQRIIFVGPPCSPEVYLHLLTESLPAATEAAGAAAGATSLDCSAERRVDGSALCYFTGFQLQALESLMPMRQALQLLQAPQGRVVSLC
ncbi:uncharacterized protein LOC34619688 [Cyclospora cayetanensis]|uniref:Uncharacterized protein LOC34619688 n=1 Tax=Cyclospora cayetanensis TaxID=88456 RepID=A0A6P6RZE8_9EIME|nr:uncharacterized protein LOC34619688 [Cyclospora cayetanensis]